MLKFHVPSYNQNLSIWIELSTFDELPIEQQSPTRPTLAQSMAERPSIEVGGLHTRFIPYADLLKAFPNIDPENTYVTTRFQTHSVSQWPRL